MCITVGYSILMWTWVAKGKASSINLNHNTQQTDNISPCVPAFSRRILLTPLWSCLFKKTNIFTTPNRLTILASNYTNDRVFYVLSNTYNGIIENLPHFEHEGWPLFSLVYIKHTTNISTFNNGLTKITDPNGFKCMPISSHLVVRPNGLSNYNLLTNYLDETGVSCHTFLPCSKHPYKIVIRTLHRSILSTNFIANLFEKWHVKKQVTNVRKLSITNLFVYLKLNDNDNTSFLNHSITKF